MSNNLDKFLAGYSYKHNPIPLDKEGVFQVRGEDPNSDFGGNHHMPELGIFRGKFRDVAEYATSLEHFWQWGPGGSITEIKVKDINSDSTALRKKLLEERAELEKKLEKINESIGET